MVVSLFCLSWSGCGTGYLDGSAPPYHPGCENACFVDADKGIYINIYDEEGGIRAWGRHSGGYPWDMTTLTITREGENLNSLVGIFFSQEDETVIPPFWMPNVNITKNSPHLSSCEGTTLSFQLIYDVPPSIVEEGYDPEEIFSFEGTRVEDRTVCR